MTRATLLHVLDQPTALGPAEVRELEQLAHAFPYCQTAHLLLAKAAHDQGTMLAGQRLRRAATYAADRTLLRRLIEQVEPAAVPKETSAVAPAEVLPAPVSAVTPVPEVIAIAPPAATAAPAVPEPTAPTPPAPADLLVAPIVYFTHLEAAVSAPTPEIAAAPAAPFLENVLAAMQPQLPEPEPTEAAALAEEAGPGTVPEINFAAELQPLLIDQPDAELVPSESPAAEYSPLIPVAPAPEAEPELPAQAPAIRPPVEVGEARFEFGLAETPAPALPTYELPGLVDEWAASAVTLSMGSPELLPEAAVVAASARVVSQPCFTPAAFTGDETVGYGFGESSRLGFSLQLLNLLLASAATTEGSSIVAAAAQPLAARLPPTGTFFEPDPLLLDHWATHSPPAPVLPSSVDLINNFLRRQPRLTRPAMLPPAPAAQADLSVRSTLAEPDLASETLARILVRQGKTARAIEIYEKLMVKQPEKMAYFAAQIQQLQPPA